MKTKISPTVVGAFVLGFLLLGVVALLSFGNVHVFTKPQRFVVYFEESIHGLDLGSPVKLRGVRVGRVVQHSIRYNAKTNEAIVMVVCEFNPLAVRSDDGSMLDVANGKELQRLIDRGLRAQLGVLGLATGLLFVELNFVDPDAYPAIGGSSEAGYAVVPAIPSTISEFQASLSEILSNLKRVDFPGLAREVRSLLADTRRQVNGLNLADVSSQWSKAGQAVTALAGSAEIRETVSNLNLAVKKLSTTLSRIDAQVDPAGEKLGLVLAQAETTLKTFNEAAANARNLIAAQSGLGDEATRALAQLADAAASVQRLADFLERNPNALISGRKTSR